MQFVLRRDAETQSFQVTTNIKHNADPSGKIKYHFIELALERDQKVPVKMRLNLISLCFIQGVDMILYSYLCSPSSFCARLSALHMLGGSTPCAPDKVP